MLMEMLEKLQISDGLISLKTHFFVVFLFCFDFVFVFFPFDVNRSP